MSIVFAVLAGFVWGAAAAAVNGLITKKSLSKDSNNMVMASGVLRTAVDLAALASIFLLRAYLPFDSTYSLIAAAVAMSIGTIIFTFRLAKK